MGRPILLVGTLLALATAALSQGGLSAQATRTDPLSAGCNNIVLTHSAGTPISTVAQGITGELMSIFRYDNGQARFFGWAPGVPDFAVDYPAVVQRLEPVFICMATEGEIVQPSVAAAMTATATSTATPTPTPALTPTPTPVPVSEGCAALNNPIHDVQSIGGTIGMLSFNPGDRINVTAGPPNTAEIQSPMVFSLLVDETIRTTGFPGTLSYTFPPNTTGQHRVSWASLLNTVSWNVMCVPAGGS